MECQQCERELSAAEVERFNKAAEHCTPEKLCTECENKYRNPEYLDKQGCRQPHDTGRN